MIPTSPFEGEIVENVLKILEFDKFSVEDIVQIAQFDIMEAHPYAKEGREQHQAKYDQQCGRNQHPG